MKYLSNKKFYETSLKEYGISAQGVHWKNQETQYKRFEVLTNFIEENLATSFIVDAGCGVAEYYKYLFNKNQKASKYLGIDCEESMIDVCKVRFPSVDFLKQNILTDELIEADYYICSGALNILTFDEIEIFIKKCFQASRKGFVFNYLKNLSFYNIKQHEIERICSQYTKDVRICEGYLDNDFTICMVK